MLEAYVSCRRRAEVWATQVDLSLGGLWTGRVACLSFPSRLPPPVCVSPNAPIHSIHPTDQNPPT